MTSPQLATRSTSSPSAWSWWAFAFLLAGLVMLALVVPHGRMGPAGQMTIDPVTHGSTFVHEERPYRGIGAILGQFALIAMIASVLVAYPVPWTRSWSASRRTITHVALGALILVLSVAHAMLLALDQSYRGWFSGGLSLLAFAAHGAFAGLRVPLSRAWSPAWWRFAHHSSALAAVSLTAEHVLVSSWHFGLAEWFATNGWS